MASTSVKLRNQGNQSFSKAGGKLNAGFQKRHLEEALRCYVQALQSAAVHEEVASAAKNIGVTSRRLAGVVTQTGGHLSMQIHHFKQALEYFNRAQKAGKSVPEKSGSWRDNILVMIKASFQEALDGLRDSDCSTVKRVCCIEEYVNLLDSDSDKAEGFLEMGNVLFKQGIKALDEGDYKLCLNMMSECYRPLQEAKRLAANSHFLLVEIQILQKDVYINRCVAESIQARKTGDALLEKTLQLEEDLNMDMVYEVIDWYKQAIILTRENEVEMEAVALSCLGHVYDKVLKLKVKAKENFMKSIQLAESLKPKTFNLQDWYQVCVSALERYQKEVVEQEESIWQKQRQSVIGELKEELKLLNENEDSTDLLKLVYEKFPPKNKRHKLKLKDLKTAEYTEIKKALQTAIVHYHPDKQKSHGLKWQVLCEEITKRLTRKYECFK